jgi:hypothetical protein
MDKKQVLQEYRTGNAEKRLSIFLYYRDLRNEFSCIDREHEVEWSLIPWSPKRIREKVLKAHGLFHRTCRC